MFIINFLNGQICFIFPPDSICSEPEPAAVFSGSTGVRSLATMPVTVKALYSTDITETLVLEGFEDGTNPLLSYIYGGSVAPSGSGCLSGTGNHLHFGTQAGNRFARIGPFTTPSWTKLSFLIEVGTGTATCSAISAGEEVLFQYWRDDSWITIHTFSATLPVTYTLDPLPESMRGDRVYFRWYQATSSNGGLDEWALGE